MRKFGPYYFTINMDATPTDQEREIFGLLKSISRELEDPATDWQQKDHWVYAENKVQSLVDPLPRSVITAKDGFDDIKSLKNMILLINANGDLVDPTRVGFGHTFLPFITGYTYNRFHFFTQKSDTEKLTKIVSPLEEYFKNFQSR